MTTARILDSGRERRIAGLVPEPRLVSCSRGDSAGCIIATIELPDIQPYSSETAPRSLSLYTCVGHSPGVLPEKILASAERPVSQFLAVIQTFATGARGIFGAADILAKHKEKSGGRSLRREMLQQRPLQPGVNSVTAQWISPLLA